MKEEVISDQNLNRSHGFLALAGPIELCYSSFTVVGAPAMTCAKGDKGQRRRIGKF